MSPSEAISGQKVMIINEMSGSGGDALPWYFRKAGLGPLIGARTWGGIPAAAALPNSSTAAALRPRAAESTV